MLVSNQTVQYEGTGSILVSATAWGAHVLGADIDIRVIRDGKKDKHGNHCNVYTNFSDYGLRDPLGLLRVDAAHPPWRPAVGAFADAILCDPPYGVRAGGRKVTAKDNSGEPLHARCVQNYALFLEVCVCVYSVRLVLEVVALQRFVSVAFVHQHSLPQQRGVIMLVVIWYSVSCTHGGRCWPHAVAARTSLLCTTMCNLAVSNLWPCREGYIPSTTAYGLVECLADLLESAARLLVMGGRLCFWLPDFTEDAQASDGDLAHEGSEAGNEFGSDSVAQVRYCCHTK